jgi:hypothetical protein
MAWFRLDDQGAFHAKVLAAGNDAYGAWCRAGQWSSGHGTEGRIPRSTALTVARQKVWDRLVATGLCESLGDDGWQIHDFLDWNPTVEEVDGRRATRSEAGRQGGLKKAANVAARKQAASKPPSKTLASAQQNSAPIPIPIPIPIPERSEIPEPVVVANEPERPRLTAFEEPFWRTAYVDSVRSALHGPWSFPDKQSRSIRSAVEGHCDSLADIDAWLRRRVPAFVQDVRDRAAYYAGLGPDGFLKWLNEESAKAPPQRVAVAVPVASTMPEPEYTPEQIAAIDARLAAAVERLSNVHAAPAQSTRRVMAPAPASEAYGQTPAERETERKRQIAALAAITASTTPRVA